MFTLKIEDPSLLKKAVSIVSDFITEATLNVKKEGIQLIAMDPANICMVMLNLLPTAFSEYKVDASEDITLNIDYLQQALRRAKPTDIMTMTLEKNKLKIVLSGKSTKRFFIPLLEKEEKEKKAPELDFSTLIEIDAAEFKDYIEDTAVVSDAVVFESDPDKFIISAGETGSKVHIELPKTSDAVIKADVKQNNRAIYSIEYMRKIANAAALADTVTAKFSSDYPINLSFKALNKLEMQFILAPRIENK